MATTYVRPVSIGTKDVKASAEVISQAFSPDPLIRFVMDERSPDWNSLDHSIQRWQQFRVEGTVLAGTVLGAFCRSDNTSSCEKCTGVVLMYPSSRGDGWFQSMRRITQFGILPWLWKQVSVGQVPPFIDQQRWQQMMAKHTAGLQEAMQSYPDYCYLEVIASSPSARGSGVGRVLMSAVIEEAKGRPIVLECTDEKTIPFYEKFGFSSVAAADLVDGDRRTTMWIMVRKPS